ncbi:MAG: hypothetical protein COB78_08155 [Hyphomicrobiales bacterium]|nr:MAG: hypothetical protein COB78_08155 [Hyphomicrobiales bacterium]
MSNNDATKSSKISWRDRSNWVDITLLVFAFIFYYLYLRATTEVIEVIPTYGIGTSKVYMLVCALGITLISVICLLADTFLSKWAYQYASIALVTLVLFANYGDPSFFDSVLVAIGLGLNDATTYHLEWNFSTISFYAVIGLIFVARLKWPVEKTMT